MATAEAARPPGGASLVFGRGDANQPAVSEPEQVRI
jgi:hypothetical protein